MRTLRSHIKFPSPKKPLKTADFSVLWNNELQADPVTVNGQPDKTEIPGKNKLQRFDWKKTPAITDTR